MNKQLINNYKYRNQHKNHWDTKCDICGNYFTKHGLSVHTNRKHKIPKVTKQMIKRSEHISKRGMEDYGMWQDGFDAGKKGEYQRGYRVGRLYETNQFKKHMRIMGEQTGLEHRIG